MPWIAAGAVLGSALIGSDSASSAADAQQAATQAGIGEQRRQYDLTRGDFAPYRVAGNWALQQLTGDGVVGPQADRPLPGQTGEPRTATIGGGLGAPNMPGRVHSADSGSVNQPFTFTGEDAMQEPGYQFGLDQGQQALDRKIAAMGGRVSGAALKASTRYANDYASTKYGDAYNRQWQARGDRLNRLQSLAGLAQTATANTASAGSGSANAISDLISAQGNATGAARLATGNIWAGAGNQLAALYDRNKPKSPAVDGYNYYGSATDIPMQPGGGY